MFMALIVLSTSTIAKTDSSESDRYMGWYWKNEPHEDEQEKEEKKEERKDLPPLPPEKELMSMHPKDIEKMFEDYVDQAVWKPTPQNVANSVILKDVIRRKAKAYSAVHSMVVQLQPEFNAMKNYPANRPGRSEYLTERETEINNFLKTKNNKYAYIILTKDNCQRCIRAEMIAQSLVSKIGWRLETINMDKAPQVKEKFGIKYAPTIVMISPFSDKFLPITAGVETQDRIKTNTYRSIHLLEGTMKPEQFFMLENERDSSMNPLQNVNKTFKDYFNDL